METVVQTIVRHALAFVAAAVVFVGVVVVLGMVMEAVTPRLMMKFSVGGLSSNNVLGLAAAVAGSAWAYGAALWSRR